MEKKNAFSILLVVISCISFLAQIINITCNALNIRNIKCKKAQNSDIKYSKDDKEGLCISFGFIGESISFLGIAAALLVLGLRLSHNNAVFFTLRISSLIASIFSIMYGSILLTRHIEALARKKDSPESVSMFCAEWAILNSVLFVSLGLYNLLYETVLYEMLNFSSDHHTAMFLKVFVFAGYACVLSSIFLCQICEKAQHSYDEKVIHDEEVANSGVIVKQVSIEKVIESSSMNID